jgi:hypothetical protein
MKLSIQTGAQLLPSSNGSLGALYDAATQSCCFSLWAPTSRDVSVHLYRNAGDSAPAFTVPLRYDDATGLWCGSFAEWDPEGFFYDYTLTNETGTHTVLDPYSLSMAAYTGNGGIGQGAIINLQKETLKPEREYPYITLQKREDAIIYEVSVRDFTASPDSGVKNIPGTYKAFIEKIPYLRELGITHIQLMPVLNFYYTDETNRRYEDAGTVHNNNYNWGYDPHNYFTPEGWYASEPENPESRVRELRELINECHQEGIGVLLDVVYNHVARTDLFDAIVPGYYFRTNPDGSYTNGSGCGNDVASERSMVRKLIVDSAEHWVKNYQVDGFRFDLMGLLDTETVLEAYNRCRALNPSVLFIGEGWKLYNGTEGTVGMDQRFMTQTDSVAVFNDEFRDLVKAGGMNEEGKGFLTGGNVDLKQLFYNCIGLPQCNYTADSPGDNVQYLVCHDGLTLHDCIAHNAGLDEDIPAQRQELIARIKVGNALALTCQGIAFLHAGQERGRTKPNVHGTEEECVGAFVRNSYDASDSVNRIVWTLDEDYAGLLAYTRGLIALRKRFDVFRIGDAGRIAQAAAFLPAEGAEADDAKCVAAEACSDKRCAVKSAGGAAPKADNQCGQAFGYTLDWTDGRWFLLFNAAGTEHCFTLASALQKPVVFVDGTAASPDGITRPSGIRFEQNRIILDPYTAAIVRSEEGIF